MSSLLVLPPEIRQQIFELCKKEDLASVSVCSKFWYQEVVPLLWKNVTVKRQQLRPKKFVGSISNLKFTSQLTFIGMLKLDGYQCFAYAFVLGSCDPHRLTSLTLRGSIVKDAVQLIPELVPMLRELHLEYILDVFNDDFFSHFQQLRSLTVDACPRITDEQLERLSMPQKLQKLVLTGCNDITANYYEFIQRAVNLEFLEIDVPTTSEQLAKTLIEIPRLVHFDYLGSAFKPSDLQTFKPSDIDVTSIARLHDLKSLSLGENDISDEGLSFLSNLPNLRSLTLESSNITDRGCYHLSKLIKLIKLSLPSYHKLTMISDVGIEMISRLHALQELNIHWCTRITDKGFKYIGNLKCLHTLLIQEVLVSDEALGATLPKLKLLKVLDISNCDRLTDDVLTHIEKLERLEELICYNSADDCGLSEEALKATDLPLTGSSNYRKSV